MNNEYDYTQSGFDSFLSRSVDELAQQNLGSPGPVSQAISFDRAQLSGKFPDIVRIGTAISLNGPGKNIVLSDGTVDRLLLGYSKDGF